MSVLQIRDLALLVSCLVCLANTSFVTDISNAPTALLDLNVFHHFRDNALINSVKCCSLDEHLIIGDKIIRCSSRNITNDAFVVTSPTILSKSYKEINISDCANGVDCVDYNENGSEWRLLRLFGSQLCKVEEVKKVNYFPKCCPLDFGYDKQRHKCIPTKEPLSKSLQVLKVGISDCPIHDFAVVDFESNGDLKIDERKTLSLQGQTFNHGQYCIDTDPETRKLIVRACLRNEDVCGDYSPKKRCLWKCCPHGAIYVQTKDNQGKITKKCVSSVKSELNLNLTQKFVQNSDDFDFGIIAADLSKHKQFKLSTNMPFEINQHGDVETTIDFVIRQFSSTSMVYCIEQLEIDNSTTQNVYLFAFSAMHISEILKNVILFASALFAILTILCYAILPEMQNLHGKCIMIECLFLMLGSSILCYTKVFSVSKSFVCTFLAYGTIFAFMGLFAWLNIICLDMWMAFGVVRSFKVKNKKSELKKFLFYCLYGFGIPTVFVTFIIIAERTHFLPESITPKIGNKKCYFDNDQLWSGDYILYFLIPMSLMLIINVFLFIKTIIYCIKVKNEIQNMRNCSTNKKINKTHNFKADKEKIIMLLKLFLIMGIPWIFEMISSYFSFKRHWILNILETVMDTINSAKGIIIFCIFILKKNVLILLAIRFGIKTEARQGSELTSLNTMATTTH